MPESMNQVDSSALAKYGSFVLQICNEVGVPYARLMTFGARLTAARKTKGLTQAELGKGLGTDGKDVSKAVVYGWEKDQHHPRVDQLELICQKLGCSADYLLLGQEAAPGLSPESLAVARTVDTFEPKIRAHVLRMIAGVFELAQESSEKSDRNTDIDDEPPGFLRNQ
jgi:transcriptional regulator with XRE-family HTH domain